MNNILGLPPAQFLQQHWQKKLAWGRQWMPATSFPLDTSLLKELAGEHDVDSRLVRGPDAKGRWEVAYGPFDSRVFASLPAEGWTLLIQDLEKWLPELQAQWSHFDFVPAWRRDDVMISWAAPGGSVGPHVDRYDVFLAQVSGERQWSTGSPGNPLPDLDAGDLRLCQILEPVQHDAALPGDVLYLPPGVAHHGVARTECLTLSFGMRAPSTSELVLEFAQEQASRDQAEALYCDADLQPAESGAWLTGATTRRLQQMLSQGLQMDGMGFELWAAQFLTGFSARRAVSPPLEEIEDDQIRTDLRAGRTFHISPWSRRLGIPCDGNPWIAIDGECYRLSQQLADLLLGEGDMQFGEDMTDSDLDLLVELAAAGHVSLSDHD